MIGQDERGEEDNHQSRKSSSDEEAGTSRSSFDSVRDGEDKERLLSDCPDGRERGDDDKVVKIDWRWVSSQVQGFWNDYRSVIWVVLMIWANSTARGLFIGEFRKF